MNKEKIIKIMCTIHNNTLDVKDKITEEEYKIFMNCAHQLAEIADELSESESCVVNQTI